MSITFDGAKLLQAIIINEKRVAEFYRQLATEMEEGKGSKVFNMLAQDEEKHEKFYTSLLNQLPEGGNVELTVEDAEYINLLIENNMFSDSEDTIEKARGKYAKEDALYLAEKIERDAILFVHELRAMFPNLVPDELKLILAEEKQHLKTVLSRKADATVINLML